MSPQQNESTSNTLNAPISNDENANPNTNNTNNNKRERDDDESDDQPIPPPLKKRKTKADRRFDLDPMSRSRILSEDCYHAFRNVIANQTKMNMTKQGISLLVAVKEGA
eukprot:1035056_1